MPTSEAPTPSRSASKRTDRKTWRRLAPTIRRSASSRVRCPTVIEKVLKIVKPPTNSEMRAKTSSAVEKKPSDWFMALDCSAATVCPVTTSTPAGSTAAIPCSTAVLFASGVVMTSMVLRWPSSPKSRWAVGRLNAAMVAPARLSAVPNPTIPERVKVCGEPGNRIRTWLPTLKWYLRAVPWSITTWVEVDGGLPATRRSEESRRSALYDEPMVGAPPVVMAFPFGAMNWA